MSEEVKKKKKLSKSAIVLIVGSIIIAIPCIVLAVILISASFNTGVPNYGNRYLNDLTPEITNENVSELETSLKGFDNVENVEIVLLKGQLRISIDTNNTLTSDDISAITNAAYELVNTKLPVNTYFKQIDGKKMYDLQITVYNIADGSENMIMYVLNKNSNMDAPKTEIVSEPKDPDLVNDLYNQGKEEEENPEEPAQE